MDAEYNAWWLLEFLIDGRVYRYTHDALTIDGVEYRAGFDDPGELERGAEDAEVSILDPDVDWVTLSAALEGAPCEIYRWVVGESWESRTLYVAGLAVGTQHGRRDQPVAWTVGKPGAAVRELGLQVPDELAKVTEDTFPYFGSLAEIVDQGRYYPIVFGAPGRIEEGVAVPVMPVPMAQWAPPGGFTAEGNIIIVISERLEQGGISKFGDDVQLESDEAPTGLEYGQNVAVGLTRDLLGRTLWTLNIDDAGALHPPSADEDWTYYVGLSEFGTLNGRRDAYSVVRYMLQRWALETVDWTRFEPIADELGSYLVDTWIDDPVPTPWDWIEEVLLSDLPFEVATSTRGRYLRRQRFTPDGTRVVLERIEGVDAIRVGGRERDSGNGPLNEFTCRYRLGRDDQWLGRMILTGRDGYQGASTTDLTAGLTPSTSELVKVVTDARCSRSYARFGLRQADPIDLEWTWDTGTAQRVLEWRVARDAVPAWRSVYWIRGGHELETGDEVSITDADFGLTEEPMIVESPPVVGRTEWARVEVRYRAE